MMIPKSDGCQRELGIPTERHLGPPQGGPLSPLLANVLLDVAAQVVYAGLELQINEAKSAVGSAFGRKFLGNELWLAKGREVKCAVARKAETDFKARIRQLTRRWAGAAWSK